MVKASYTFNAMDAKLYLIRQPKALRPYMTVPTSKDGWSNGMKTGTDIKFIVLSVGIDQCESAGLMYMNILGVMAIKK
jgi:hypothetical protein